MITVQIEATFPDLPQLLAGIQPDLGAMTKDILAGAYRLTEAGRTHKDATENYSYCATRGHWWGHCQEHGDIWQEEAGGRDNYCPTCDAILVPF